MQATDVCPAAYWSALSMPLIKDHFKISYCVTVKIHWIGAVCKFSIEAGPLKHSSPAVSQSAQQPIIQEIQQQEWWDGTSLGEKRDERLRFIRTENKVAHLSTRGCIIFQIAHFYLFFTIPSPPWTWILPRISQANLSFLSSEWRLGFVGQGEGSDMTSQCWQESGKS